MNYLYLGDNLGILRKCIKTESIDLCYIDPPFQSARNYQASKGSFSDLWEWDDHAIKGLSEITSNYHGLFTQQCIALITGLSNVLGTGSLLAYLVSMTLRITEIHRVLKPTGSFYLHCDPTSSHYLKLVLDAVFCSQGGEFRNDIIWVRSTNPKGSQFDKKKYSPYTDNILFYTKSSESVFKENAIKQSLDIDELEKKYDRKDELGRFTDCPILRSASMGERPNLAYEYKGYTPPYGWRVEKSKLEKIDNQGNLGWSSTGKPFRKLRPENDKGHPIGNFWNDISLINPQAKERLGYPTQKPEALLERIIKASSNENDIVLDAYCGCGTTVAVCQKLDRQWIGIDINPDAINLVKDRLSGNYEFLDISN